MRGYDGQGTEFREDGGYWRVERGEASVDDAKGGEVCDELACGAELEGAIRRERRGGWGEGLVAGGVAV